MANNKMPPSKEEPLSAQAITRGLETVMLGQQVEYRARVESTNDVARQLADAGAAEGFLVITDEQTAGRGRLGRAWLAPAHSSLLMSLVLRPKLAPHQTSRVTMAIALGACDGIHAVIGLDATLKWPNDILLRGKKCGGILAESSTVEERVEYVIVGLGLNANFAHASIEGIPADATTMADELGVPTPRVPLAQAILRAIERYYLRLRTGENLRDEFAARLTTLKRRVRAQAPWGVEEGMAEDVDDDGALLLRRADGTSVRLIAGDVTLAR